MTDKNLVISALNSMKKPKRENRLRVANIVCQQPNLFKVLVSLTFLVDDKLSIKAAWVLEWICTHDKLEWMFPHLDVFTQNISRLRFDSSIRPCAKICEHIAKAYTSKKDNEFKNYLRANQMNAIIEAGFDWLIYPQKNCC